MNRYLHRLTLVVGLERSLMLGATAALMLPAPTLLAQSKHTVSGTVRSSNGESLIGVSIRLLGSSRGTITDVQGRFTLQAELGDSIQLSSVGMQTLKMRISKPQMSITMREDRRQIDEVVVTGYQKIKSRVYTGAATSVKMKQIHLEGVQDISRMLEGRVPGLSIQNISGTFGAAPRINIRGGASILGNVQPLWVIDGAVYEDLVHLSLDQLASGDAATLISSAVAGLNAADIEDIQVLKDASATSIYGARALNGVIVVTTKSGRRESPLKVSYSTENTMRLRPSYSEYDLLNSQETMGLYQEMMDKGYFNMANTFYGRRSGVYYLMNKALSSYNENTNSYLLENTEAARRSFLEQHERANTDWFKELFRLNPTTSHAVSFTAGGKNSATYASVGFYHDGGWTIADKVQRITANLKNTFYIGDKFQVTLSGQGNIRQQKAPGTLPQRKNTSLGVFERDFDINPFNYALGTSRTLLPHEYYRNNWAPFNIHNEYASNKMDINVLDFKAQIEASYKITPSLEARALFSTRHASTATRHEISDQSNQILAYRGMETSDVARTNTYLYTDPERTEEAPQSPLPHGGILNKNETSLSSYLMRLALDYDHQWGEHNLKAFGFTELRSANRSETPFTGYGIQYDRGRQVYTNPIIFSKILGEGSQYFSDTHRYDRGLTFSGSATYGYAGKYIANALINIEGSNASGKNSNAQWLPTWNVGAKWNVDKETFFKRSDLLTALALRMSYGLTAKMNEEAVNANSVYQGLQTSPRIYADREHAIHIQHLENRDLTWEKMYELNFGLEASFFNDRVRTTLDLYQRNAFDLIDLVRTSGIGGQYYKYANFGDMRTQGLELSLSSENIRGEFSWNSTFTLSLMNQKITRLLNTPNALDLVSGRGRGNLVGYPKGSLFSYNFQGLSPYGLPSFDFGLYPINRGEDAQIYGADFGDTQYTKSYLLYHGPIEPQVIGGLSNTFSYKGWELSLFLTAQAGNKIRLNPTFDPTFGDLNVFSGMWRDRWLNPGDEQKTDVPTIPSADLSNAIGKENIERAYSTYNYSQQMIADGSFIRLKHVSLSYNLPKDWLKQMHIASAKLQVSMTNPFLLYSDKRLHGQDPEYYRSGGVSLPTPRQCTFTLQLGF